MAQKLSPSDQPAHMRIVSLAFFAAALSACGAGDSSDARGSRPADVTTRQLEAAAGEPANWVTHGGDYAEDRFSTLERITPENVERLGLVWAYDMPLRGGVEATPLVVGGVMYTTGPWSMVFAFDARSGELLWSFDPQVPRLRGLQACCDVVNRGVALYEGHVFVGTLDGRLIALDAGRGTPVWEVVTVDQTKDYSITGAPRIVNGLVIIGNGGAEYGVRGYVTAYDAGTGEQAWRTFTVPGDPALGFESAAMERAAETWSGGWWSLGGGGTAWDGMAYDPALGLLYVGTGNGSPWNWRVRSPGGGDNLYLSSILALRASDGEIVWHYQTTPGDHWDFTATQPMILATLQIERQAREVLMQAPKNGFFYVLDRATGELISAETFVEVTWADGIDLETGRPRIRESALYGDAPAVVAPTAIGGHNWQPMAFNPGTGLVYVPITEMAARYSGNPEGGLYAGLWNTGADFRIASIPMGFLVAWDPVRQEEVWRVGHEHWWNGGVLTTASGLVFQGAGDGRFVAYRASTGEAVWDISTGLGIIAPPVTYELDGVQYVTVSAGWGGNSGRYFSPAGDAAQYEQIGRVMTFALDANAPMPTPQLRATEPYVAQLELSTDAASTERGESLFAVDCSCVPRSAGTTSYGGGVDLTARFAS